MITVARTLSIARRRSSVSIEAQHSPAAMNSDVAAERMRADVDQRVDPHQHEAADDRQRAGDARGREVLAQDQRREHEPAERRGRRLDHGAMAERREDEAGVAEDRKSRAAQGSSSRCRAASRCRRHRAGPSCHASGSMIRPDHMKRWNARSAGDSPIAMPWRAAVRPTPQHAAAPTPQQTAMIFTLGASAADGAWTVTGVPSLAPGYDRRMRGAMRPPAWLACNMPTQRLNSQARGALARIMRPGL